MQNHVLWVDNILVNNKKVTYRIGYVDIKNQDEIVVEVLKGHPARKSGWELATDLAFIRTVLSTAFIETTRKRLGPTDRYEIWTSNNDGQSHSLFPHSNDSARMALESDAFLRCAFFAKDYDEARAKYNEFLGFQ